MGTDAAARIADQSQDRTDRVKAALEEAKYAAVGVGDAAADAARALSEASHQLPDKLREAPEAIASVAGRVAVSVRRGFCEFSARGREIAGEPDPEAGDVEAAADDVTDTAGEAVSTVRGAVDPDVGSGKLQERTVAQLRERAAELGILGRTTMRKQELVEAIRARQ